MADGMLTANAPDPDNVFDPLDDAEDSDDSGDGLGGWLLEQVAKFYGVEFDVGDREYSPEEIEEIQELFRKLREGEPVDLTEIQEFYPDLYEYLSKQPEFDQYFGGDNTEDFEPLPAPTTEQGIIDLLRELGYSDEQIQEIIGANVIGATGEFKGNPVLENILNENGYDGSYYAVEPTGTGEEPTTGEGESTIEEDMADMPTFEESVEQVQEEFPTWEDIWEKIKDIPPSNPQEWGDAVRAVFEAAGIPLPSGDISDILNGGYGVIWDPATGVWTDPGSGKVFVPGLPVGLPPSSVILGTIEEILSDPVGTITNKIERVLGDIVADPSGFIEGILTGALEVPDELWDMILGGVAVGQDLYDWLIENGIETVEETTTEPPLGGEEEPDDNALDDTTEDTEPTEERDPIQQAVTDILGNILGSLEPEPEPEPEPEDVRDEQIQESVLDLLGGAMGGVDSDMSQEDTISDDPVGDSEDELTDEEIDCLTFGGESCVEEDPLTEEEKQEAIDYLTDQLDNVVGDPDDVVSEDPTDLTPDTVLDEPEKEPEEVLSGEGSSGGSGGGAGRVSTQSEDFLRGLSYTPLQIAPIPARPLVDYTAGLFTQPTSRMSGLQLGGITAGLFGDMIG